MIPKVKDYEGLDRYAAFFASGAIPIMVVYGSTGVGKSTAIQKAIPDAKVIVGAMTALGLYEAVFRAENAPLILDDIDGIYRDPRAIRLLKAICQTEKERRVSWASASNYLSKNGLPTDFLTSSSICIIANEWHESDRNVQAVVDRGILLEFDPSPQAVHEQAANWFGDREVYEYIGTLLPFIRRPSFRIYITASKLREGGFDWRSEIRNVWGISDEIAAVIEILADPRFTSEKARVAAFTERTGVSRPTWYRLRRALKR